MVVANVVLLATSDWDHPLWTNKQHVACALAELGHRVLYVDSLGVRGPRVDRSDSGRILRRLRRGFRGPRKVRSGVWVISPLVLPGQTRGWAGLLNRWSLNLSLLLADLVLDLRRPLLWTFNPQTRAYLNLNRFHAAVYLCVDRIQAQPGMPVLPLEEAERDLCSLVNALFTTSPELQASLGPLNAGSHGFGNVADAVHFGHALRADLPRPVDWPATKGPVLIFIGAIDAYKLDLNMLEALIERTPHWTYLFIGPVGETDPSTDVSTWKRFPHVHQLGPRPYASLPAYLAHADVALLPLQINDYTRHMYPMKFFEYLAAGRPVVATAIPSLREQRDVALLCEPEVSAFEAAIQQALAGEGPSLERRLERAQRHTYRTRTQAMLDFLSRHGLMPEKPLAPQAPRFFHLCTQLGRTHLSAQLRLALLRVLESLGQQQCAEHWLRRWLVREPFNITLLNDLARRRFAQGDHREGRRLIERVWKEDGEAEILHQLLFRRRCPPGRCIDQLAMLDELASSTVLPMHHVGCCRRMYTDRAIDVNDVSALRRGVEKLEVILTQLESDPDTYRCLQPKRKNRAKLLISVHLTRLRALMALKDTAALNRAAFDLLASARRYDPFAIDRITAISMPLSVMGCLTIAAVMAWHADDPRRFDAVVDEMERLCKAFHADRFDVMSGETHADHRGFADAVVAMLQPCRWRASEPSARPSMHQLVEPVQLVFFSDLRRERAAKAQSFLQSLGSC